VSVASPELSTIAGLVERYHAWLRDRTALKQIRQWTEITTPFLDRHNDYIQIYATKEDSGGFLLTDDGTTISDLEISGCALDTPKRKEMLGTTLNGFGVRLVDGAIQVHATADNFALRKHNLVQAILAVNDLFYLASPTIKSLFIEDVSTWLDLSGVRYMPRIKVPGLSGFDHVFDFAIPKSSARPERLIRAVTNPNRDSAQSFAFAWLDTRPARPANGGAYAIINDNERPVPATVTDAFDAYGISSVLWSHREVAEVELAA
jgi:hypothetical protein